MIPSMSLRLQTMIRAMRDVVIPTIPASSPRAVEQANIVLASLDIIQDQERHRIDEMLVELREEALLLRNLAGIAKSAKILSPRDDDENELLNEGERVAALDIPSQARLAKIVEAMRRESNRLVEDLSAYGSSEVLGSVKDALLTQVKNQVLRWRVGNLKSGLENDPYSLPSIAKLFEERASP